MIRNPGTCRAYSIRPYPDGRKGLFLRSIWGYEKLYDPFFDLKKGYAKLYDPFFDLKNGHEESIVHLFESKKGYGRWHNLFFESKNGYAKRYIGYFCRGVLYTPHQDSPKRNV